MSLANFITKKDYHNDRKFKGLQIMLLSRLQIHGKVLYKRLLRIYDTVWIGWRFPYAFNFLSAPFLLFYELLMLVKFHNRNIKAKCQNSVILVHFISLDSLIAILFKKLFGYLVILYAIGSDVLGTRSAIQRALLKWVVSKADMVFCVNTVIQKCIRKMGCENTIIIPTPFLEPNIKYYPICKKYDVISVGALEPLKAHELLIRSCEYLDDDTVIAVIGGGSLKSYLVSLAEQYPNRRILFLGNIPQKKVWIELQKAKVYVHTSISEGVPSSILEAIWFKLPVICVKSSFTHDLISLYGFKIFEVKERNPRALALQIKDTLENYESYKDVVCLNKELLKDYIKDWDYKVKLILHQLIKKQRERMLFK